MPGSMCATSWSSRPRLPETTQELNCSGSTSGGVGLEVIFVVDVVAPGWMVVGGAGLRVTFVVEIDPPEGTAGIASPFAADALPGVAFGDNAGELEDVCG